MIPRVFAQQICNPVIPLSIGCGAPSQGGIAVGEIVSNLIGGMFIIAFLIAVIYLMTGGFHWITSGGDKASLESARNKIIHAIVGLIVVASTWAIAGIAGRFVGLDIERLPIPMIGTPGNLNNNNNAGDCSYARNGEYRCRFLTPPTCVQCVNGSTQPADLDKCSGQPCSP